MPPRVHIAQYASLPCYPKVHPEVCSLPAALGTPCGIHPGVYTLWYTLWYIPGYGRMVPVLTSVFGRIWENVARSYLRLWERIRENDARSYLRLWEKLFGEMALT